MLYQGSRYTKTKVVNDKGHSVLNIRTRMPISFRNAQTYIFTKGDRLDGLANKFYNDPQLWWVFLEVNTKYRSELDIKEGDELIVPNYSEVLSCLK